MTLQSFLNLADASSEAQGGASSTSNGASRGSSYTNRTLNGTSNGSLRAINTPSDGTVTSSSVSSPPIAIVGMSCKFGGDATNAAKFWDLCVAGKDSWTPTPTERFNAEALYHPDGQKTGRHHVKGGHFLQEDVGLFDAAFFNFSGDVASAMDPQLRLLMECVYEAIESAGIPAENLSGSNTSVFSGSFARDYFDATITDAELLPASFITGNGVAMFSNRISHFFDLQGASMTIDTGCSTSMAALHQAVRNIQLGESDISIVGSACALLNPDMFIAMSSQNVLSAEGRCFSWDQRATGYGRGEGVAVLVLKRLDDALRNGDFVHSVIRETGLNQDGKTATISSPSMEAQRRLIEECYKRAGLDLAETGYVEAHMTGTLTGDPIEAEALARTFGKHRTAKDPVIVGSCKPNIGHTEPVSGLAAVIKTAHVLQNGLIPPNTNYEKPNPLIPLEEWNLQVPTALTPWPHNKPLRASINNFGYGGTNGHIIMERGPTTPLSNGSATNGNGRIGDDDPSRVYIISSKDSTVTQAGSNRLATYIRQSITGCSQPTPADLAYTLAERRSRFPWAIAVKARSLAELADRLEGPPPKATRAMRTTPRIGFVFNGQGAQWHAMGRELITAYPIFRSAIWRADQMLKEYGATWSMHEELMRDAKSTHVHETELSQPVSVALQLCLVDLLTSWDITPSAVTSHSSGEIAAAYAVGALSFKEALGVAYYRGELALKHQKISSLTGGMLAAGMSSEKAEEYLKDLLGGRVVVACINSPNSVTLSGDLPALKKVASRLEQDGVFARLLKVPLAYHSHHMMNMAQEYKDRLSAILPTTRSWSGITFASPVTGGIIISPNVLGPDHWVRNLTSPVLFSQALESMCSNPTTSDDSSRPSRQGANVDIFVEIGAHSTLAGPIKQTLKERDIIYGSCLKRSVDAVDTMQDLACELLVRGYPVSLKAVNSPLTQIRHRHVHDLPSYAWNHTTRYWYEPRIYKEHRHRRMLPHELLGTPVSGSNRQTPTWRNFLRIADIPWLADHQLESTAVLPGAGYIVMAVEAVRLLTDSTETTIHGYRLRDIDIMNALRISDASVGVETQFSLRPCSEKELDHKGWYEFELWSVSADDSWTQHCKGYVLAERFSGTTSANRSETKPPRSESFFPPGMQVKKVDTELIFEEMRKMNIYHGPAFQNLISCRTAANKAITTFAISTAVPGVEHSYVLHPTTLDTIFQAFYACVPEETKKDATVVPRSIHSMFVPRELRRHTGEKLRAFTSLVKANRRGATSNAVVINDDIGEEPASFLQIDGFYAQGVSRAEGDEPDSKSSRLCAKTQWEMNVLHDFPTALKDSWRIILDDAEASSEKRWRRVSYQFICDAVAQLEGYNSDSWEWYHKLFFTWMNSVVELGKSGNLAPGSQGWSQTSKGMKQRLIDDVAAENAAGRLICRVGHKLANIIRGEVTPLELMMEDSLLNQYYEESPPLKHRSYKHLRQLVELYGVKQPGANVLEIGAGTGGATMIILEGFGARAEYGSGTLLGHYDFTDISSGFFEAARQKFAKWGDMMDFKKLDIEKDSAEQSFTPGSYDLIVASIVLHATKSLSRTMTHVRKLLKPGGKLFLLETTQDRVDLHLVFGTLPGWWLSEEPDRKMSPNASLKTWDVVLRATGFTGIDFEINDCEDSALQSQSTIVSTAQTQPSYPSSISIVHTQVPPPQTWLEQLTRALQSETRSNPTIESLESLQVHDDRVYIFTAEMTNAFVDGMDCRAFEKLQRLLVNSQGVLWLSCSSIIDAKKPLYAQAQGLLRTMKQEDSNKRCILLDFDTSAAPWTMESITHIVHVLRQSFDYNINPVDIEWEYAVKDSILHVPRFYPDLAQDRASAESRDAPAPELEPFRQPDRDLVWEIGQSGLLNDLYFTEQIKGDSGLSSGMVEIEAKAFGLNFRDVMVALDQLDESLIGHDCSGIIKRLGPDTEQSGLKVGDRVCGISKGRFASTSRAFWTSIARIPDDMSWEEAASLPIAYTTAYVTLVDIARLEKGERVLIHAATGGVGQAAVMLAQHIGAEVFVTCGTEAKRDFLMQRYHVHPDHIFSSRDISFAPAIMAKTNGKGVDVVLNSLAGPMLKATWDCIGHFGRFLEIGKMDLEAARRLDLSPFARSATMTGFDILQYCEWKGKVVHRALSHIIRLCHEGIVSPAYPITPYSISDMEMAMRKMQGGSHIGKLVLVPRTGDQVKVVSRPRHLSLADPGSTYMIIGGLSGIGRAITLWMIDRGADNILILSRRGASDPDAASLLESAQANGCNLEIRSCDISSEESLTKLLTECAGTMAPIRGVIQGAMQLDDTVLERMTYEQWQRAILPKVAGTMNLHRCLHNLSFFIMLSSIAGVVGNVSQANYAAGNAFQDALARHRTAKGLPATAIDLGPVMSVGYVAEGDENLRGRVERNFGSNVVTIDRLLRLIEAAIRNPQQPNPDKSQVITCIADYDALAESALVKRDRRFRTLQLGSSRALATKIVNGDSNGGIDELVQALSRSTGAEAAKLANATLVSKLTTLFNIPTSEIDTGLPLTHYGVDSLVAVELRNWLSSAIKAKVTIFEILQSRAMSDFAALIANRSGLLVVPKA